MHLMHERVVMLTEPPRDEDKRCGEQRCGPKDAYFGRHTRTLGRTHRPVIRCLPVTSCKKPIPASTTKKRIANQ